jgi:hypothetical protein
MRAYEKYAGGNGSLRQASVSDLERDLGEIRRDMSRTIQEIEAKLSPGGVVNQLLEQFRGAGEGGGEFVRNLGDTVKSNPVPVMMVATGLGALLLSGSDVGSAIGSRIRAEADEGSSARESVADRARRAKGSASERVEGVQRRMHDARWQARERADRAREGARRAQAQSRQMVEEQPLVLVGLGLALGAAIAGATPRGERERALSRSIREEGEGLDREPGEASASSGETQAAPTRVTTVEPTLEPLVSPGEPLIPPEEPPRTD